MSVDVRQICDELHDVRGSGSYATLVRLYALDECKRVSGDTRKRFSKTVIRERGLRMTGLNLVVRNSKPQREVASIFPGRGQSNSTCIALDEIERQVVKGGPELINNFASENRDLRRGLNQEVNLFFAVRIVDDLIRVGGGSKGMDNPLDCIEVLRCPDDFCACGIEAGNHTK